MRAASISRVPRRTIGLPGCYVSDTGIGMRSRPRPQPPYICDARPPSRQQQPPSPPPTTGRPPSPRPGRGERAWEKNEKTLRENDVPIGKYVCDVRKPSEEIIRVSRIQTRRVPCTGPSLARPGFSGNKRELAVDTESTGRFGNYGRLAILEKKISSATTPVESAYRNMYTVDGIRPLKIVF